MYVYGPGHLHGAQPIAPPHGTQPAQPNLPPEAPSIADEVDISEAARWVEQVRQLPEIREERVAEVRRQILAGTYETQDKLEVAIERLLNELA